MKDTPDLKVEAGGESKASIFLQAAIPFAVTFFFGAVVTAVSGLFVYANVVDVKSRDFYFVVIAMFGLGVSAVLAYVAARRTIELDPSHTSGSGVGLLRKYRRAIAQPGADTEAGQYSIGEHYLRELLGRRGA